MLYSNCPLSFSAPLTDKPPKILFPSENKISNMELQLGKSIMGFPPAAYLSHFQMTGNRWLYKSSSTHLQALNTDWWWHFANSKRKGQQFSKCFPYMQMVGANVPKADLSTMKSPYGARVPYTGSPHGNAATFSRCCLSSLTRGHSGSIVCECACVGKICVFVCCVFFQWQHIAWFLGTVRCPHGACRLTNGFCVCCDEADGRRLRGLGSKGRAGWVRDRRRGGGGRESEEVQCLTETLPRLPCDAAWIQVVHLKAPPWLTDQEWKMGALAKLKNTASRVCKLLSMHEQVAQHSYLLHLSPFLFHWDVRERDVFSQLFKAFLSAPFLVLCLGYRDKGLVLHDLEAIERC